MSKKKAAAKQRRKNDAAYKRALGLSPGAELPTRLGSTGRSTGKPTQQSNARKTTRKGKTNKASAGTGAAPRPRKPVVKAQFAGKCGWCGDTYAVGTSLGLIGEEWAHTYCVTDQQQRQAILNGQTYRSQKPSGWRVGQSPGSSKVTR